MKLSILAIITFLLRSCLLSTADTVASPFASSFFAALFHEEIATAKAVIKKRVVLFMLHNF